jgi:ferredoxin-thioredoxin reductase catalytic chain
MAEKNQDQTRLFADMVAKKQGWSVNPDQDFTATLVEGLTVNWNRYGYYLCPCRDSEGSREADSDLLCPCTYSWEDIADYGHCYCALYLSRAFVEAGKVPGDMPDRRFAGPDKGT